MKNLFKTPKGMMRIIKQNAMAVVAIGIAMGSYGLMSFGASSKSDEMITFEYKPPTNDPYSQANVENLSNWELLEEGGCLTPGDEAACTIEVHENQTLGGTALDPAQVELNTSGSGQIFKVEALGSTGKGYTNPVNRTIL